MTLMSMACRRNVPRCCAILYFARTLTYSVGRFWATRLRACNLEPCGFGQMQGPCGQKSLLCPIVHIAGDANCWGDLLSGWVTRSRGPVCAYASVNYTKVLFAGSDKFPPKEVVRDVQAAVAEGGPTGDTTLGVASMDCGGLYRVEHHGHHVICAPGGADTQKK